MQPEDIRKALLDGAIENRSVLEGTFISNSKRPIIPKKSSSNDRVKCKICGKMYTRSGLTGHRGSKYHQSFVDEKKKLVEEILNFI